MVVSFPQASLLFLCKEEGMPRSDLWSAKWCCDKLLSHNDILEVAPTSENSIQLTVRNIPYFVSIVTMSQTRVELNSVPDEFHETDTEFLLNIPKNAYFSGELLSVAADIPLGVGGIADLYSAVLEKDFRNYIPKEVRFILRGLNQHTAVRAVTRLNSRSYQIHKHNGQSLRILALNEYDLTSDALRTGIEIYGQPDFVLASNPNCRLSSDTKNVARMAGTGVLVWRQLLGALNN
jgi:hypothetical protein